MLNKQKELAEQLTDKQLMQSFYASQILICGLALFFGIFFFEHLSALFQLFNFSDYRGWMIGVLAGLAIFSFDIILMNRLPEKYYDDGGINDRIFTDRGFFRIIWIAFLVAFSEELLFRGVIQTQFGIWIASIVFALCHIRYLTNWFLFLNTVVISFLIGILYEWTGNLASVFAMHFVIDGSLGLYLNYVKNRHKNDRTYPVKS